MGFYHSPMTEMDSDRVAEELIGRYGGEAELIAAGHADTMLDRGDLKGFRDWEKVRAAIRCRAKPVVTLL